MKIIKKKKNWIKISIKRHSIYNMINFVFPFDFQNDKITELKNLVSTGAANAKMNKSGILKKSIDKIRSLETENVELKSENQRLRQMLGMKALSDAGSPLSPPTSNSSSPMPHLIESTHFNEKLTVPKLQPSPETDQKIIFIQRGVSPHSKFALCIFMFSIVVLNSFGSLILTDRPNFDFNDDATNYNVENARRAILSTMMDDVSISFYFSFFFVFIFKIK